jgi:hypothetical protein
MRSRRAFSAAASAAVGVWWWWLEVGRWMADEVREGPWLGRGMGVERVDGVWGEVGWSGDSWLAGERVRSRRVAVEEARSVDEWDASRPPGWLVELSKLWDGFPDRFGDSSPVSGVVVLDELLAVLALPWLPGSPPSVSARLALAMFSASRAYSTS